MKETKSGKLAKTMLVGFILLSVVGVASAQDIGSLAGTGSLGKLTEGTFSAIAGVLSIVVLLVLVTQPEALKSIIGLTTNILRYLAYIVGLVIWAALAAVGKGGGAPPPPPAFI